MIKIKCNPIKSKNNDNCVPIVTHSSIYNIFLVSIHIIKYCKHHIGPQDDYTK